MKDRREWSGLCDLRQALQQGQWRCSGCDLCGRSLAARERSGVSVGQVSERLEWVMEIEARKALPFTQSGGEALRGL